MPQRLIGTTSRLPLYMATHQTGRDRPKQKSASRNKIPDLPPKPPEGQAAGLKTLRKPTRPLRILLVAADGPGIRPPFPPGAGSTTKAVKERFGRPWARVGPKGSRADPRFRAASYDARRRAPTSGCPYSPGSGQQSLILGLEINSNDPRTRPSKFGGGLPHPRSPALLWGAPTPQKHPCLENQYI